MFVIFGRKILTSDSYMLLLKFKRILQRPKQMAEFGGWKYNWVTFLRLSLCHSNIEFIFVVSFFQMA